MYCGIDLAVKRRTYISIFVNGEFTVFSRSTNDEIIEACKDSKVIAIDSPLSRSQGFREVDKEMIRNGYKVLPPSWMKSLVDRAIELSKRLGTVIETHPTSSAKNMGINWKDYTKIKDEIDAILCALVAYLYDIHNVEVIRASDGVIYLVPKEFKGKLVKVSNSTFKLL